MDRREHLEDVHDELRLQTWNLFPERWRNLYQEEVLGIAPSVANHPGDEGSAFDGEAEIPVTNLDEIDRFYDSLSQKRGITGEQAMRYEDPMNAVAGYAAGPSFWRADG